MLCLFSAMGLAPEINVMYVCMYVPKSTTLEDPEGLLCSLFKTRAPRCC